MTLEEMDTELAVLKALNAAHHADSLAEIRELLITETTRHAREFAEE